MKTAPAHFPQLASTAKRIAQALLAMGSNRVELLVVEIQEARVRLLQVVLLALGVATFGLLTGIALSALVVVIFWEHSPMIALLLLTGFYAGVGGLLYFRLARLQRDWQTLPLTLDQLRKDCQCLDQRLN
jgi:uncharacterized membrane protein YqjE